MPRLRYDRISWLVFLIIIGVVLLSSVAHKKNSFADGVQVEVQPLATGDKLISERDVKQALLKSFGNTLEGTELEPVKQATERLNQAAMKIGDAVYKAQQAAEAAAAGANGGPGDGPGAGPGAGGAGDKVVDAEYEEVDDKKKKKSA